MSITPAGPDSYVVIEGAAYLRGEGGALHFAPIGSDDRPDWDAVGLVTERTAAGDRAAAALAVMHGDRDDDPTMQPPAGWLVQLHPEGGLAVLQKLWAEQLGRSPLALLPIASDADGEPWLARRMQADFEIWAGLTNKGHRISLDRNGTWRAFALVK